jgi:hypothetical protein
MCREACLLCLISSLRDPLFQRASIVDPGFQRNTTGELKLALAKLIPPGFYFGNGSLYSDEFQNVLDQYTSDQPLVPASNQCRDMCMTKIKVMFFPDAQRTSNLQQSHLTQVPRVLASQSIAQMPPSRLTAPERPFVPAPTRSEETHLHLMFQHGSTTLEFTRMTTSPQRNNRLLLPLNCAPKDRVELTSRASTKRKRGVRAI